MGRDVIYQGKGEEAMLRVVGGEEAWSRAAPNKWYYNPAGPFKWKINSAGWVYVAKPSILKVAGDGRFGWKVYRIEKDGMMKESDVQFFSTKEEAMSRFNALNANAARNAVTDRSWDGRQLAVGDWVRHKMSGIIGRIAGQYNSSLWNVKWRDGGSAFVEPASPDDLVFMRHDSTPTNSLRSRNAVVQKALNAALPVGGMGASDSTILWRMIDGGKDEPYHDEYQSRLDRMNQKNITEDTVAILKKYGYRFKNADTSVLRETAVNANASRVFKPGEEVRWEYIDGDGDYGVVVADKGSYVEVRLRDGRIEKPSKMLITSNASRTTNAVVAKALNAQAVCNASYSAALKAIMDAVKPYMDRRITDDTSWRYPALVISKLRDVCERAVMSAGRYDGKRPPHRVYDVECVKDGFKFSGNLIVSGLMHSDDPDDVSAFDEYDMILSLGYAGKA